MKLAIRTKVILNFKKCTEIPFIALSLDFIVSLKALGHKIASKVRSSLIINIKYESLNLLS